MKPANLEMIHQSFTIQAPNFAGASVNFTKKSYLDYTLACVEPNKIDTVLEVAAGTCACGRAFAPLVQTVVCLDATPAMLEIGKQEAQANRDKNMVFVQGYAEELPFLDHSFDIVISRLACHHFSDLDGAFCQMARVLKPAGKLVMIDLEATAEPLRATEDEIQALRDPSHVKNLSKEEMLKLFSDHALTIEKCEMTVMPQQLEAWLELTKTPATVKAAIIKRMKADIDGTHKTGFYPYQMEQGICFPQRWVLTIGRKP